jgi:hypothetical protein
VGGSTGKKSASTSADHASDVLASVDYLRHRPEIDPQQIGLCGHSEGGLIAPLVASRSPTIAFIVLIAGPAVPGDTLILFQLESQMRQGGADSVTMVKALAQQRRVFSCVKSGAGWESVAAEMKSELAKSMASMTPEQRKSFPDSAAFINANVEARLGGAKTPWFHYFVTYDPAPVLEQVPCPILALFGELDYQVPVSINKVPMEASLGKSRTKDWKVQVVPGANHLFQKAVKGYPSEYPTLKKEFIPGFLELLAHWITDRVNIAR